MTSLPPAPIRGADIVARTTVPLAAGEGCTYEWKGHGLRLQVPADALEPLSPPATIIIQASLSGHYHLPDNTQLVSAVYWIAFPGKFSRPVTLEVHHCAALEQSHTLSSLSFVRAKCSQETLPYNFKRIQGGVFSASSRHGAIELSHFSGVGIASEESEQSKHYTAHTFYIHQSPTTWLMHFIIICDLELLFRVIPSARMRSEGYSSRSVCLSVYLSVYNYSRTTGYEASYERYQQLQCYEGKKKNVAILLKRLHSRDMAC